MGALTLGHHNKAAPEELWKPLTANTARTIRRVSTLLGGWSPQNCFYVVAIGREVGTAADANEHDTIL